MRAILIEEIESLKVNEEVEVTGPQANHLIKVARIKLQEDVLILNGKGLKAIGKVSILNKKDLTISITSSEREERKKTIISVALGLTKKEAFELMIKEATEFGVEKIWSFNCEFGQNITLKEDRVSSLIESATIQSNNPFLVTFESSSSFSDLESIIENYDLILYMTPKALGKRVRADELSNYSKILLIVGPEGGLSNREEEKLKTWEKVQFFNFKTPILRSPTALAGGLGFLFGNL
jgi:16S rRNA (uracil1498-N3)-methyltransferase